MFKSQNKAAAVRAAMDKANRKGILTVAEIKDEKKVKCTFIFRSPKQLCYTGDCTITLSEAAINKQLTENKCEFFELIGAHFTMSVQMNDQGRVTKVFEITKAA